MRMKVENPFGATSREEIARFEGRHGIVLPEDYARFLLKSNGGRPVPDGFAVPGWPHVNSVLHHFHGLHDGNYYKLDEECARYSDRIPKDLMPIAADAVGNVICLGILGKRRGKIYFWDHEEELDDHGRSRQDYRNVYLVGNSLGEFLNKLED